ncbi:MAG TPA: hypothetical protein VHW00_22165 [Thermoanaerobaculia bacterium]|nr:hypothetical protein [Thermoanaerobaculia bacterium]
MTKHLTNLRREYQVTLLGRAWLELANARRQLGLYGDALEALDEAERCFEGEPFATKQLARAWLSRGTVLFKVGELTAAERSLRRAINLFAAVDDLRSIARVRMVEAGVLFERSNFSGARERWLSAAMTLEAAKRTLLSGDHMAECWMVRHRAQSTRVCSNLAEEGGRHLPASEEV